jgi:hypothetical protein
MRERRRSLRSCSIALQLLWGQQARGSRWVGANTTLSCCCCCCVCLRLHLHLLLFSADWAVVWCTLTTAQVQATIGAGHTALRCEATA